MTQEEGHTENWEGRKGARRERESKQRKEGTEGRLLKRIIVEGGKGGEEGEIGITKRKRRNGKERFEEGIRTE